ncbi:MAG: hypothetical protein LW629_08670 [Burkholderiales bacterium]|jgi:hypothetical protein|nr:hypothetical protein [Burkholderiales bacterium]
MSDDPNLGKILDAHVKAHFTILVTVMSAVAFVVYFDEIKQMLGGLGSSLNL